MEENENKVNKIKVLTVSLIISITLVITVVILGCIYLIAKDILIADGKVNKTSHSKDNEYVSVITEAVDMIKDKYIDIYDIDDDKMMDNILASIASSVGDPYTRYITDEEFKEMLISGTEEYSGIGVHLTYDKEADAIIILGIMPDSPALESDLKVGDYIVQVEDTIVNYDNYYKCIDILKGQEDTEVNIVIARDKKLIKKTLTRRIIKVNNVESEILDGNIGYIKILQFDNDIYNQFKEEYNKLMDKKINGLVIDVRNNPGGLVTETIKMLDLLLPKGDVLRLEYRDGKSKTYRCSDDIQIKIPLTVLVNGSSASAAEIFASALKDSEKGVVIGTKTYGKGIVQEVEKLETRGALSITVAKYYTKSGVEINKNGIEPNIKVELTDELKKLSVIPREEDLQLKRAIEYINKKIM